MLAVNIISNFLVENGLIKIKAGLGVPVWTIVSGLLVAIILVKTALLWKYFSRFIIAIVHEAGHSLFVFLLIREIPRVNLHHDTTGQTWSHSGTGFKNLLMTMAGYPFPSTLAVLGAYLLGRGLYKDWYIFLLVLLVVELIFLVRNFFGILLVSSILIASYFILKVGNLGTMAQHFIAVVTVLLLGVGGFETAREVIFSTEPNSDLDIVSSFLHIPSYLAGKILLVVILLENFFSLYLLYK